MKIIYIANSRIPTEKAHGIQIVKMCEAFSKMGHEVTLVIPRRFNFIKTDIFSYYKTDKLFNISYIYTVDLVRFGKIGFWIQSLIFSLFVFVYILFIKVDLIYSRDELPLFFLSFIRKNIVWESHTKKINFATKRLLDKLNSIITISNSLKEKYTELGYKSNKILVAHDGVDLNLFTVDLDKDESKRKLNLPNDKKIVLYTGHLYDWKGAQVLADASELLSEDTIVLFVGGTTDDICLFKQNNTDKTRINILGYRTYSEIPLWMSAADVLIIPNIDNRPTSPMKLFEYMASNRPIVASNTDSIAEILNKDNSVLVQPGDHVALAVGILQVFSDKILSKNIAYNSLLLSNEYSWDKRAKKIINFIQR